MKFKGGSYPYLCFINSNTGTVEKSYYRDTVAGGNTNEFRVYPTKGNKNFVVRALGYESHQFWKNIPDSVKNIFTIACYIRFNSSGNYYQFNESGNAYLQINYYNPDYASTLTGFSGITDSVRYFMGNKYTNKLGYDYIPVCISILKPKFNNINILNNQAAIFYPNPVSDELFFQGDRKLGYAEFYDMTGRTIYKRKFVDNAIDVKEVLNGAYVVRVFDEQGLYCAAHKIIVNH